MSKGFELMGFDFNGSSVTTFVDEENQAWFVGKDVATILGYTDAKQAIRKHVDEEDRKKIKNTELKDSLGGVVLTPPKTSSRSYDVYDVVLINESGLYALIFGSKLEAAKEFKHWVTSEVLPNIRKHGMYISENNLEQSNEELLAQIKNYKNKVAFNIQQIDELKIKNKKFLLENKELERRFKKKNNEYQDLVNEWNENVDEFNEAFDKSETLEIENEELKEENDILKKYKEKYLNTKKELDELKSATRKAVKIINNKLN